MGYGACRSAWNGGQKTVAPPQSMGGATEARACFYGRVHAPGRHASADGGNPWRGGGSAFRPVVVLTPIPGASLRRDTGLLGSDRLRVRGRQGPADSVSVTSGRVASSIAGPWAGARLNRRGLTPVALMRRARNPLVTPQVMGTPGLISRWGLKTTATVGAAFRGFIPVPRANRIRPDRIWGGYRLLRRSQRVIEWERAVTGPCA
jgi:hypothetical protein